MVGGLNVTRGPSALSAMKRFQKGGPGAAAFLGARSLLVLIFPVAARHIGRRTMYLQPRRPTVSWAASKELWPVA